MLSLGAAQSQSLQVSFVNANYAVLESDEVVLKQSVGEVGVTTLKGSTVELRPVLAEDPEMITGIRRRFESVTVSVFPNPFNSSLTIKTDKPVFNRLVISDMNGKQIKEIPYLMETVDLEDLRSGVYFISLLDHFGSITTTLKVIKN